METKTLLDEFAIAALPALIQHQQHHTVETLVESAYKIAQAMCLERERWTFEPINEEETHEPD